MKTSETLLDYLIWADCIISELVEEELDSIYSIQEKLTKLYLHLVEEYMGWLMDITNGTLKDKLEKFSKLDLQGLIIEMKDYHQNWRNFLQINDKNEFTIDEGDGLIVKISVAEVIYNLVNHATYHRGQIVKYLRELDIKTPITDYYWFKIHMQKKM